MYRSSPFRSTLRTNVQWFQQENGFAWQAQYICNVCMNQPCTRSAKTLKKCRKTWGYNKFMVRKNGHENAPLQVDGAQNNGKYKAVLPLTARTVNAFCRGWLLLIRHRMYGKLRMSDGQRCGLDETSSPSATPSEPQPKVSSKCQWDVVML